MSFPFPYLELLFHTTSEYLGNKVKSLQLENSRITFMYLMCECIMRLQEKRGSASFLSFTVCVNINKESYKVIVQFF